MKGFDMKNIDIERIETKYTINEDGTVVNTKSNRTISGSITSNGYKRVTFFGERILLHRLIATKYIKYVGDREYVNHKNGNKLDNRVENLEWCTMSENVKHAFDTGLKNASINPMHGENNGNAILTDKLVIEMLKHQDLSFKEIAEKYNVSKGTIKHIFRGRTWKHIPREVVDKVNKRVKMSLGKAREIRAKLANGVSRFDLSREYDVTDNVISKIARNITWKENDIIQKGQI